MKHSKPANVTPISGHPQHAAFSSQQSCQLDVSAEFRRCSLIGQCSPATFKQSSRRKITHKHNSGWTRTPCKCFRAIRSGVPFPSHVSGGVARMNSSNEPGGYHMCCNLTPLFFTIVPFACAIRHVMPGVDPVGRGLPFDPLF